MSLHESQVVAMARMFVGREAERATFAAGCASALSGAPRLFLLHGPPGIGKTSLLHAFAAHALQVGFRVMEAHAEELGRSPGGIAQALEALLRPARPAQADASPVALLLDGWERVRALDEVAQAALLRLVEGRCVVVLAGREPPSAGIRASELFRRSIVPIALRALTGPEAISFLDRRKVPAARQREILAFANGYPLALALAADAWRNDGVTRAFSPTDSLIGTLWDHFFASIPDEHAHAALDACAVLRLTDEESVAALFPECDARRGFAWLRDLSFVERTEGGLYLHDLARDLAVRDMKWRNPRRYAEVLRRALDRICRRFERLSGDASDATPGTAVRLRAPRELARLPAPPVAGCPAEWHSALAEFSCLFRGITTAGAGLFVPGNLDLTVEAGDACGLEEACAAIRKYEGDEQAGVAAHWYARQPSSLTVVRGPAGELVAFVFNVRVDRTDASDREKDPVIARAWRWMEREMAGRPWGEVFFARHWMTVEAYQGLHGASALCGSIMVAPFLRSEHASFAFQTFWKEYLDSTLQAFESVFLPRKLPEFTFVAGDREQLVVCYDRRGATAVQWLEGVAQRALSKAEDGPATTLHLPFTPVALERDAFVAAVRDALRALEDPAALAVSPLLDARMVVAASSPAASRDERVAALRAVLVAAIDALEGEGAPLRSVLRATYLAGGGTHERAAESLRLSYGTFRRYLARGVEALIGRLWLLDGGEPR